MARLLIVIPTLSRGGAERVVSVLSRIWSAQHAVTVVCFDARNPAYPIGGHLIDCGLPGGPGLLGKGINALRRMRRLLPLIAHGRFHRIATFTEAASLPTLLACRLLGRHHRLWVSVRESVATIPRPERLLMRLLYHLPGRIVAPSRGVARGLTRTLGLAAARISVIPNPLDRAVWSASHPTVSVPRPFVLAAGRLTAVKGFTNLVVAFARIAATHDIDLVILGDGPEHAELEATARVHGIAERVHLVGAVEDPWAWMAACRVFVLSSRHEGWPNALAEALAMGRPCVATDCEAGPRELIRHGRHGLLVPVDQPQSLADAMAQLLDDPAAARRMGDAAAARMRSFTARHGEDAWLHGLQRPL